ncbi:imelysin family protein [Tenacibaculum sp. 190524A05c]|uniref:Lipoprotein n=1 Tax=Tenacibaculum platacis TaxID=3137852 RepID=A0ABM9P0Y0_9FLAO
MMRRYFAILTILLLVYSCSSSDTDPSGGSTDNFDRSTLLANVADNMAKPVFADLKAKLEDLKTKFDSFNSTPNTTTFTAVKTSWLNAYKVWQYAAIFEIGKAEELQFVNHFNIYPVTVADVDNNISTGTYDLNSTNNHDAQGFPALDYLFFGVAATETDIIAKYTTDANASNYKKYVNDVIAKMTDIATEISDDWNGSYREDFVSNSGNTATSALNKFVNDFIFHYEKRLRANKFGIPVGNFSAAPLPEKVEAFYAKQYSKELALDALAAVNNVFSGRAYGSSATGASFQTYLNSLSKSTLSTSITNQFESARTQINTLSASLYEQINTNNQPVLMAYDELQKAVVLLKVDMLQAFNVSVDFVDADGD